MIVTMIDFLSFYLKIGMYADWVVGEYFKPCYALYRKTMIRTAEKRPALGNV